MNGLKMNHLIDKFTESIKDLKVGIIGETIVDEYHWIELMGSSPKSKCPSGKILKSESYQGGAAYIKRIAEKFCNDVVFITGDSIVKTRYVEESFNTKYLELKSDDSTPLDCDSMVAKLEECDVIIVADFGHNLIDKKVANYLRDNYAEHMCLMCQTNSSNYGYNNLSPKYHSAGYVCLDQKELGLILQVKDPKQNYLYHLWDFLKFDIGTLTMGVNGAFSMGGNSEHKADCFKNGTIIDTVGAGDTFFTLASLAYAAGLPVKEITVLGSLGGYYNTTFPATKKAISPNKLKILYYKDGVEEHETVCQ